MTEHAFDPIPDEQDETMTTATAGTEWIPSDADAPAPNAVVSLNQVLDAITKKHWEHEEPNTALWLNTAFPITTTDPDAVIHHLAVDGVVLK